MDRARFNNTTHTHSFQGFHKSCFVPPLLITTIEGHKSTSIQELSIYNWGAPILVIVLFYYR